MKKEKISQKEWGLLNMIREILQQGFVLKEKGFYKRAIESFYKALEVDSSSLELLLEIAECYYFLNDEERALNYIELVLDKCPTHIGSLKLLKNIFINKKAFEEAEQTAKNIYCISKEQDDLVEIFELLNKQGRYAEIFTYQIDSESSSILYEKAFAKFHLGELNEALVFINRAIEIVRDDKKLLLKGQILFAMNNRDECSNILNEITLKDSSAETLNFAGLVKQHECNFDEALKYFFAAIQANSKGDEYYYNCASTYFKKGNLPQAKKYYNLAISLAPENKNYHFALANLYYSEKNYKRAMEELNYDFFEANLLKAIILYDSGYLALAKKELDKLVLEQPNNELIIDYSRKIEEELKIS